MTPPGKMGRPSKGNLTDAEFEAIVPILAKPRKAKGGSLQAAATAISKSRGADSAIDPRTKEGRTVSARWVSFQLVKRGFAGKSALREKVLADPLWLPSGQNSNGAGDSGSRMGYSQTVQESPVISERTSDTVGLAPTQRVESERKEATA